MNLKHKRRIGTTDLKVDLYGFGCASVGNLYHAINDAEAGDVLSAAWNAGFTYYDTAPHYGQGLSERRTGDMLRHLQGKEYVLSTKVGRLLKPAGYASERHGFHSPMPFDIHYDYSYDGIMKSFEQSLHRLGLDRIDILYMHDIGQDTHGAVNDTLFPIAMDGGYKAMDELRQQGLIKAIGLGVNEWQVCEKAMDYGDWDCFLLAGRYTLLEQDALDSFLPKAKKRGSSIVIGGAFNSGILATGVKNYRTPYYNYSPAPQQIIDKVDLLENVCNAFKVPLAAAALQFPLAHPSVASVIPGMGNVRRIRQTLDLINFQIPNEFWEALRDQALVRDDAPMPQREINTLLT